AVGVLGSLARASEQVALGIAPRGAGPLAAAHGELELGEVGTGEVADQVGGAEQDTAIDSVHGREYQTSGRQVSDATGGTDATDPGFDRQPRLGHDVHPPGPSPASTQRTPTMLSQTPGATTDPGPGQFGPNTAQVERFLALVEQLSESEWRSVDAAGRATTPVRPAPVEAVVDV